MKRKPVLCKQQKFMLERNISLISMSRELIGGKATQARTSCCVVVKQSTSNKVARPSLIPLPVIQ